MKEAYNIIKTYFLQIETPISITSILIAGITAMATVVVFQFNYIRTLHKEITKQGDECAQRIARQAEEFTQKLQEIYREQVKDNKDVIINNTKAIVEHTLAVEKSAEASSDLKDAFHELRMWFKDSYGSGKRGGSA